MIVRDASPTSQEIVDVFESDPVKFLCGRLLLGMKCGFTTDPESKVESMQWRHALFIPSSKKVLGI